MGNIYPLLIEPRFEEKIWGGRRLRDDLGKAAPANEKAGESWEIYDGNRVLNGVFAGLTIEQLRAEMGQDLMGHVEPDRPFPLLTKFIDAHEVLSVQVHPDDAGAQRLEHEPNGKTECWYILDVAPGAQLTYGFNRDTSPEEYERLTREGRLEEILRPLPVQPGDVVFIPAGTVHAIGGGILLYELQQTSDTTYRLYDWNRVDEHGRHRQLHVERARQVLDYHRGTRGAVTPLTQPGYAVLVAARYFTLGLLEAGTHNAWPVYRSPVVLCTLDEAVEASCTDVEGAVLIPPYSSALIPAAANGFLLEPAGGNAHPARVLAAWVPVSPEETRLHLRRQGFLPGEIEDFLLQFAPAQDPGHPAG